MVDVNLLVRKFLLAQSSITALLGTNANGSIYASSEIPEHADAVLGPFIQIFRSGGKSYEEILPMIAARVQVRAWADIGKKQIVANVYGAIFDALHGASVTLPEGVIMSALEVTGPQEMIDPDTKWVAINSFYTVMARPN